MAAEAVGAEAEVPGLQDGRIQASHLQKALIDMCLPVAALADDEVERGVLVAGEVPLVQGVGETERVDRW